jgi:hypothetical protein
MTLSKKKIVLAGIALIWLFAALNRLQVYRDSEIIPARAHQLSMQGASFGLTFTYKGVQYKKEIEENPFLTDNKEYQLLIQHADPAEFIVFTFWGFIGKAMTISFYLTLVWMLFVQIFFTNIKTFKLTLWKRKK